MNDFGGGVWSTSLIQPAYLQSNGGLSIVESLILGNFSQPIIEAICHNEMNEDCQSRTGFSIRSIKLAEFYRKVHTLDTLVGESLNDNKWTRNIEGNTFVFFDKVKTLQEYADDTRVKNICEIGFNTGYSALNFLLANPNASLVSFDIFSHSYTSSAADALYSLLPERNIQVIAGDSAKTVPRFAKMFPSFKCDLIFIGTVNHFRICCVSCMTFFRWWSHN
jgi:hypothetical protein